jgi:hypothetical protein
MRSDFGILLGVPRSGTDMRKAKLPETTPRLTSDRSTPKQASRIGFGIRDELGHGFGWHRWVHHHHIWHAQDGSDRRNVARELETQFVVERRIDGGRGVENGQRVAVTWAPRGRTPCPPRPRDNPALAPRMPRSIPIARCRRVKAGAAAAAWLSRVQGRAP